MPLFLPLKNFDKCSQSKPFNFTVLEFQNWMQVGIKMHSIHSFFDEIGHISMNHQIIGYQMSNPKERGFSGTSQVKHMQLQKLNGALELCRSERRNNENFIKMFYES